MRSTVRARTAAPGAHHSSSAARCLTRCACTAAENELPADAGALLLTAEGARAFSAGFDLAVMGSKGRSAEERAALLKLGVELCLR